MTISESMREFLPFFIETARDRLKNLNDALLVLEKNQKDVNAIENMFQNAHSLKGEAAMMPFDSLAYLMHVIEDVFYEIKEGRLELAAGVVNELFKAFDQVGRTLDQIEKNGTELDVSSEIESLKKLTGVSTRGGGKSKRPQKTGSSEAAARSAAPIKKKTDITEIQDGDSRINYINVPSSALDSILGNVEELLVAKQRLDAMVKEGRYDLIKEFTKGWARLLAELRYMVMRSRLIPLNFIFERLPRMVRDIASSEGKEVNLTIEGGETPLDRTVMDHISDPLLHIIRNAIDHGIESKEERVAAGKPAAGELSIKAERERGFVVVKIRDDGRGLDRKKILEEAAIAGKITMDKIRGIKDEDIDLLIFEGISTSPEVTEIAGRGVGMTAVRSAIQAIGGSVKVRSEQGKYTEFILRMPLTLAIIRALLVKIGENQYAIPASAINLSVKVKREDVRAAGGVESFVFDGKDVPVINLETLFGKKPGQEAEQMFVIVEVGGERLALSVSSLSSEEEIIVKTMPSLFKNNRFFSGVTILGSGTPALIVDVLGVFDEAKLRMMTGRVG